MDDSLSPGYLFGRSESTGAGREGGIPPGPSSGCGCAHLGRSATASALCRAGKVISWKRTAACELPCTAAADPAYHRRPEKAIMRDFGSGKVWGISEGKELLEVSSSPPPLHNCTSLTAL